MVVWRQHSARLKPPPIVYRVYIRLADTHHISFTIISSFARLRDKDRATTKWNKEPQIQAQSLESLIQHDVPKPETQYPRRKIDKVDLGERHYISWRKFCLLIDNWWLQEFSAWLASFVFIAAIFGVLLGYNKHPLPEWPYSITLNTLLSLLAQLAKGCLLVPIVSALGQMKWIWFAEGQRQLGSLGVFDGAGSGLWGGLQLLYTLRGRWLGSLGAVLAILILGLEIFTQQAVTYPSRQIGSNNASIPITSEYGDWLDTNGNYQLYMVETMIMNAAMISGVVKEIGADNFDTLAFTCPSGNCTFPIYSSLAVCSKCADLSSLGALVCVENNYGQRMKCEWTISTHQVSVQVLNEDAQSGVNSDGDERQYNLTVMPTSRSINFKDVGSYITAFSVASASTSSDSWLATECVLFWCVQTLNTSVIQGVRSEEVLSYVYNTTNNAPTILPGETAQPSNRSTNGALINGTYTPDIQFTTENLPGSMFNGGTFTVDPLANFTVSNTLGNWLSPSSREIISKVQEGFNSTGCLNYLISESYYGTKYSSSNNATDTTSNIISALALSMTNAIRMDYISEGANTTLGTSWTTQTYVHVRWEWLLFPILLDFLALFFLVAVMATTTRSTTQIWKSDPLALIFHGLDHGTQIEAGDKETLSEMREMAEKLSVKLVQTRNGSKLSTYTAGI